MTDLQNRKTPGSTVDSGPVALESRPKKGWTSHRASVHVAQVVALVAFLGLWEIAARQKWIDPFFWGQPSKIFQDLWSWVKDGSLFTNTAVTFLEAAVGFVIAVVIAVPLGIFLARSPWWYRFTSPLIDIANSTPRFALAPLFVLFLGLGYMSKIVLVISVVLFPVLINTMAGVKAIDDNLFKMAYLINTSRLQMLTKVIVPATGPWLIAAMRLSAPYALAAAVVGEMISANQGLGYLVVKYSGLLDTSATLAAVFMLALCGWALNALATWGAGRAPAMRAQRANAGQ